MYSLAEASKPIIARIWHGRVRSDKAKEYYEYLVKHIIPDIESIKGNLGVTIMMKPEGDVTHIMVISYWESIDAIKQFAGEDISKARYYEEDKKYLLEFEPSVEHYYIVWHSLRIKLRYKL